MKKKDQLSKLPVFIGLVIVAILIFGFSVATKDVEDSRILGVHQIISTPTPAGVAACSSTGYYSCGGYCASGRCVVTGGSGYSCGCVVPPATATPTPAGVAACSSTGYYSCGGYCASGRCVVTGGSGYSCGCVVPPATATPTPRPYYYPTATPTPRPYYYPTVTPAQIYSCVRDGETTLDKSLCCSGNAVYFWSAYMCGNYEPTAVPTMGRPINPLVPTMVGTRQTVTLTPTRPTICVSQVTDIDCAGPSRQNCKWYINEKCEWMCNHNCVASERCEVGNLFTYCTNKLGQTCQQYRNSDCTIDCTQNCVDTGGSTQQGNSSAMSKTVNKIIQNYNLGSCSVGVDYNKDGIINSLDVSFCKNNASPVVKTFNSVVEAVNRGIPLWVEWMTIQMGL